MHGLSFMFNLNSPSVQKLSRRNLLEVGALSALGVSLPNILRADQNTKPIKAKSCIFIYQYGGLSQLDSWDPKPDSPEGIRGPYKPIATKLPGFRVGELMPKLASKADKYTVIRSMSHTIPVHDIANRMLLAGQSNPPLNAPAFGSIVTKLKPSPGDIPAYVWLQKFGGGAAPPDNTYLTGGYLGMGNSPLLIGNTHLENPSIPGFKINAFEPTGLSTDQLANRIKLLSQMEVSANKNKSHQSINEFRDKAFNILTGTKAKKAFDIEQENLKTREQYGMHPMGQNLLLARRLVESGVRTVGVVAWTGLAPKEKFVSLETWDMHGNAGISIFDNGWNGLGWALPRCDEAVSALLDDLETRGLLDSTLVVLVGEFGRTPKISKGGSAIGRDHWPKCYSAMIAGGGAKKGLIYGASDSTAAYVKDNPVSPEDFAATLLHLLGIAPETRLSPDGFTLPASLGTPIQGLI